MKRGGNTDAVYMETMPKGTLNLAATTLTDAQHMERLRDWRALNNQIELRKQTVQTNYVLLVNQDALSEIWTDFFQDTTNPRTTVKDITNIASNELRNIFPQILYQYCDTVVTHPFLNELTDHAQNGRITNELALYSLNTLVRTKEVWREQTFFQSIGSIQHRRKANREATTQREKYSPHTTQSIPQGGWHINFVNGLDTQPMIFLLKEVSRLLHTLDADPTTTEAFKRPSTLKGFVFYANTRDLAEDKITMGAFNQHLREEGTFAFKQKIERPIIQLIKENRNKGRHDTHAQQTMLNTQVAALRAQYGSHTNHTRLFGGRTPPPGMPEVIPPKTRAETMKTIKEKTAFQNWNGKGKGNGKNGKGGKTSTQKLNTPDINNAYSSNRWQSWDNYTSNGNGYYRN